MPASPQWFGGGLFFSLLFFFHNIGVFRGFSRAIVTRIACSSALMQNFLFNDKKETLRGGKNEVVITLIKGTI